MNLIEIAIKGSIQWGLEGSILPGDRILVRVFSNWVPHTINKIAHVRGRISHVEVWTDHGNLIWYAIEVCKRN
jgi:hypothetical protein